MLRPIALCGLILALLSSLGTATNITAIFKRPVITRLYQSHQYALADTNRSSGNRVEVDTYATALAGLKPSYVSGMIYLVHGVNLTDQMVKDFNTIRNTVHASTPDARFDVIISLNPKPNPKKGVWSNGAALVDYMAQIDSQLKLDGWWFDFYSSAQKKKPEWIVAAAEYAHNRSQTIGGNVFGNIVPPSSDAVSFVDDPDNSTAFGFGFNPKEVAALKKNSSSSSTAILGHVQCNPQNGNTTESYVYSYEWNSTRRAEYNDYWYSQQASQGFTYMYPLFYPLYPGAYAFDPLNDTLTNGAPGNIVTGSNVTLYDYIRALALGSNGTSTSMAVTSSGTSMATSSSGTSTATATTPSGAPTTATTQTSSSGVRSTRQTAGLSLVVGLLLYSVVHVV